MLPDFKIDTCFFCIGCSDCYQYFNTFYLMISCVPDFKEVVGTAGMTL